jgi:outer membrane receptor protein involved in Fe transport
MHIPKSTHTHLLILSLCSYAGISTSTFAQPIAEDLGEISVTGTREQTPIAETSHSIGIVKGEDIRDVKPLHPSEVMGRIPGVHVNITGGEGHMTAIRQPITTSPVYLFLEDGIPSRSTGFFNHNALYEINLPQSDRIEVSKGPGTSLYGSDAIGGIVNVLTRPAPSQAQMEVSAETGENGWGRLLLSGGDTRDDDGYRADLNLTHSDGWRDNTDYDRQSATVRWDRFLDSGATIKTVVSGSNIDQQTAGSSRVSKDDYLNNPTTNYTPISYRKVEALRISSAYEKSTETTLLSLTPYLRHNTMDMLPNWSLSYDPQLYKTENKSLGLMAKYRMDFVPYRSRIIVGTDLDYSPGSRHENAITATRVGSIYTDYSVGATSYDYDVTFSSVSPYVHGEFSPSEKLRITAGLRYDHMSYDYDNNLSTLTTGTHRRPASTTVNYQHLSPKLGMNYALAKNHNGFIAYRHGFRVPSQSQLFRQGQAENTVNLEAIKVDSIEIGLRGKMATKIGYQVSVYHMSKKDDVVSYRNTVDGTRETLNAGETLHRGIELGINNSLTEKLDVDLSYAYAKHTFEDWQPRTGVDLSGNEMKSAPREIANLRFKYTPEILHGGHFELEWERLGKYWMDDENTHEYAGHNIYNLRAEHHLKPSLTLFGRIKNITDERYATAASFSQFRGEEFAPGMPRSVFVGISYNTN